jgi:hypothetical protein
MRHCHTQLTLQHKSWSRLRRLFRLRHPDRQGRLRRLYRARHHYRLRLLHQQLR